MNDLEDSLPPVIPPPATRPSIRRRHPWVFGCLIALVVSVTLALLAIVLLVAWLKSAVRTYTDTQAKPLPRVEYSPETGAQLQQRIQSFFEALTTDQKLDPLVLTPEDLNTLIASTGTNALRDRIYVTSMDDGIVHADVSVPLSRFGLRDLNGRYLNGKGELKVIFQDGELRVWVDKFEARDQRLPKLLEGKLRERNLAEGLLNNPKTFNTLQQLESVSVTNGALVLRPKEP
jgi:hypothetical protein